MFENLSRLLNQKRMPIKSFAALLGVSEKTAQNKLQGRTEFTLDEVEKIEAIWPEYTFHWLFERKSDETNKPA